MLVISLSPEVRWALIIAGVVLLVALLGVVNDLINARRIRKATGEGRIAIAEKERRMREGAFAKVVPPNREPKTLVKNLSSIRLALVLIALGLFIPLGFLPFAGWHSRSSWIENMQNSRICFKGDEYGHGFVESDLSGNVQNLRDGYWVAEQIVNGQVLAKRDIFPEFDEIPAAVGKRIHNDERRNRTREHVDFIPHPTGTLVLFPKFVAGDTRRAAIGSTPLAEAVPGELRIWKYEGPAARKIKHGIYIPFAGVMLFSVVVAFAGTLVLIFSVHSESPQKPQ